jgi:hypothetical protein
MKCAFCFEEMNDGATVCKVCAREQPLNQQDQTEKILRTIVIVLGSICAVVFVGYVVWSTIDGMERGAAVARIVQCVHEHGNKDMTTERANSEIDLGIEQTGKGWRAGAKYAALGITYRGDASTGSCFISQDAILSD